MLDSRHDDGSGRLPKYPDETTAPQVDMLDDSKTSYDARHTYDSAIRSLRIIRRELIHASSEATMLVKLLGRDPSPQLVIDAVAQLDEIENELQAKMGPMTRYHFVR